MSLKYDKGFQAVFDVVAPHLPQHIPLDIKDIPGARLKRNPEIRGALEGTLPECPDVEMTWYETKAKDGATIRIQGFAKKKEPGSSPKELTAALIHYHGGGMVVGETDLFARALANQCSRINVPIFSVDYRLAPENKGSVLVEDCYAGVLWLYERAEELGVDKARVGVFGESAGGGLSAGVSLIARDRNLQPPLAKQILIYPMLDDRTVDENPELEHLTFWKTEDNVVGWQAVLEGCTDLDDQTLGYIAPARAKDLKGLPSAYIDVGSLDIFREENAEYARRLLDANVEVEFHMYAGLPHAFELLGQEVPATARAIENRLAAMTSF